MKARTILIPSLPITEGTLYTVPNNTRSKWILAFVSNSAGQTVNGITLKIHSGSDVIFLVGGQTVGSGDFLELDHGNGYIMLNPTDHIVGVAGGTGVSCILTFEEVPFIVSTN